MPITVHVRIRCVRIGTKFPEIMLHTNLVGEGHENIIQNQNPIARVFVARHRVDEHCQHAQQQRAGSCLAGARAMSLIHEAILEST